MRACADCVYVREEIAPGLPYGPTTTIVDVLAEIAASSGVGNVAVTMAGGVLAINVDGVTGSLDVSGCEVRDLAGTPLGYLLPV